MLKGFVFEEAEKDYSLYMVELSKADEKVIMDVLKKYANDGCSVRNVYEDICKIMQ